jgi:hypothetical protein
LSWHSECEDPVFGSSCKQPPQLFGREDKSGGNSTSAFLKAVRELAAGNDHQDKEEDTDYYAGASTFAATLLALNGLKLAIHHSTGYKLPNSITKIWQESVRCSCCQPVSTYKTCCGMDLWLPTFLDHGWLLYSF